MIVFTQMKPKIHFLLSVFVFFILSWSQVQAQQKPPRPIGVYLIQNLSFGALAIGTSTSTVTIDPYGLRTYTGNLFLFSSSFWPYNQAIFEIEGNPGTVVHFLPQSGDITLYGSPSGTLKVNLGAYIPIDPIILNTSPPARTQVKIGGTLTVSGNPSNNPPGIYTGTYTVMIIQE